MKPDLRISSARPLVREEALHKLRNAIISGVFSPGARLKERELCDALGVSRTSVREVLRQLETEGLVDVGERNSRPIVSEITERDAYEIYELREVIEVFVIRTFVRTMAKKEIQSLRSIYSEIAKAVRAEDVARISEAVARFFDIFYLGAGNLTIRSVIKRLLARISFLRTRSLLEPGRLAAGLSELEAILEACEAGDADAAESAIRIHIRNSMAAALSGLRTIRTK